MKVNCPPAIKLLNARVTQRKNKSRAWCGLQLLFVLLAIVTSLFLDI
jgi:hypothetical protein